MKKKITVIEGDGIGPEVTQQAIVVLNAVAQTRGHEFEYDYCMMGACAIEATGEPLPDATIESCNKADAVLLGAIGHPKYDNNPSAKVRPEQGLLKLRKSLQLFANIRPVNIFPALGHLSPLKEEKLRHVDFIIFRELTGGIYFGEKKVDEAKTLASDLCTYSKEEIERVAKLAFEYAQIRNKRLTLVDKANVLETSRLWRHVVRGMEAQYPDVKVDYMFVDNAAMQLLVNPKQFDVLLTENMFGDILSDEASVLSGSLGLLPSSSIGTGTALFEPIHGSYPQAAGKNIANPVGSILSSAMMLDHFGLHEEANAVKEAVRWAIQSGYVTQDINAMHHYTTTQVGMVVADHVTGIKVSKYTSQNQELGQSTII
ncbi:MAG: 3-isopropylmalate dehydrogenase [Edaphocola sp.]